MKWPSLALLVGVTCGCAVGRTLGAPRHDYAAYRKTRIAPTLEKKMAASWHYLRELPDGHWRHEVKTWFEAYEPAYYQKKRGNPQGLRSYLATLPDGPHATLAEERLDELELARATERRNNRLLTDRAQKLELRLATAQSQRRELVQSFSGWLSRIIDLKTWGKPTSELDHELIFAFRLDPPRARCIEYRCVKTLEMPYAVPEARSISKRSAVFDVVLMLDARGGVSRALLVGPDLFSRIAEAADVRPVLPNDGLARAEAIGRTVELISQTAERKMPQRTCAREPISPIVLERECNGIRLRAIAALGPEEEDRIEIEPFSPLPGAS